MLLGRAQQQAYAKKVNLYIIEITWNQPLNCTTNFNSIKFYGGFTQQDYKSQKIMNQLKTNSCNFFMQNIPSFKLNAWIVYRKTLYANE